MEIENLTAAEIRKVFESRQTFIKLWERHNPNVKKYRYLITFTIDPKLHPTPDYDLIESYIRKQFTTRKPLKVNEAHIAREGDGIKTHVHWHVAVETLKPLSNDRFNYYEKKFGNIDFSPTKAQNILETLDYISKSVDPVQLV